MEIKIDQLVGYFQGVLQEFPAAMDFDFGLAAEVPVQALDVDMFDSSVDGELFLPGINGYGTAGVSSLESELEAAEFDMAQIGIEVGADLIERIAHEPHVAAP